MDRMVSTFDLKLGMYVSALDRPWLDTPFLLQGFFVEGYDDIEKLNGCCKYVYIDTEQGVEADYYLDDAAEPNKHYLDEFLKSGERKVDYPETMSLLNEFPVAEEALEEATVKVANVMDNIRAGDNLDIQSVKQAVHPMLESLIRNTDALLWISRTREHDDYTYEHSTDNCALAIAFGRHLGLYKDDLRQLAMGALLLDVGNIKISSKILKKKGRLTTAEYAVVKKHVFFGVKYLEKTHGITETIINMVQTHHERFDGSGYPDGIAGDKIPTFGLIAAIIDTYNSMTRKTRYSDAIAQHTALQEIYKWRNKRYHAELVEQFLQCMGVYPTGSLVELVSGEVAVVIAQNTSERLKPAISLLLDEQKSPRDINPILDLAENPVDYHGVEYKISHALPPGAYDIEV